MNGDHDELAERGMPFRLYRAPVKSVLEVSHDDVCHVCGTREMVLFGLRLNDYLIRPCSSCRASMGLRMGWWDQPPVATDCPACGVPNPWPDGLPRDPLRACYKCIRRGKVAVAHETELGMLEYPLSARGLVRGGKYKRAELEGMGFRTTVLETYDDGSQSVAARLPPELLAEMHRTPRYLNLQREYWPWHCGQYMAFVGHWRQDDFHRVAGGHGKGEAWFHAHGAHPFEYDQWEWIEHGIGMSYVHECLKCGLRRVYVDSD
jgi:uncharacterized protein CbrC (UPF0167 family)